ncbi:MAG TPA: hypothetical protein VGY54_17005, partial [Polyangiaceae bacterium]|nr:hypothetical protein [Polyangiaceae bacterium]
MSARRVALASVFSLILALPVACSSGSGGNAGTGTAGGSSDAGPDSAQPAADAAEADVAQDSFDSARDSADGVRDGSDEQRTEGDAGGPWDGSAGKLGDAATTVLRATAAGTRSLALDFDVAIQGEMAGTTMAISVTHNAGTLQIAGSAYPIVVYEQIPWPNFSLTLYQAIAVLADRWAVIWFYCDATPSPQTGRVMLTGIDYEDTLGAPLAKYGATGTCSVTKVSVDTQMSAPASILAM